MDFVKIENTGKRLFQRYPRTKRILKRVYHLTGRLFTADRTNARGNLRRVTPKDSYEYFYGYYGKSPWDSEGRYILALRAKKTYRSPAPREEASLVLIDTAIDNHIRRLATVRAWNVQQGCMAQWLGPDFKSRIIYNDYRDGSYCSVIYHVKSRQIERILPLPVYDVSKDGRFALSLDFSRLHRLRPGYGYSNLPDLTAGQACPDQTCIWKMDLRTAEVTELLKYTDLADFEPVPTMKGAVHKVNHLMISPSGKRFMVLHRWFYKGQKHTRLVTADCDGTNLYNLSDDDFVSHCDWKNDEEILSFLRKKETGDHYYLLKDRSRQHRLLWPNLNTDGHCSYSPDRNLVVTDTYPDRTRIASVYICAAEDNQYKRIAKVYSPFRYDNDCRCDLHPRWNHRGDQICIDSVHEGRRALYVLPLTNGDIPLGLPKAQEIQELRR